jgi:2-polyprenyl-6-methoxyphenol hydroxylase-like FAD-dependent oxidoreductase
VVAARTVIVAGAGIGGLTAALALAQRGFEVTLLEAAPRLQEIGAGLQLSPNAARVLIALGIEHRLKPHVVIPEHLVVRSARSGRLLAQAPLGANIAQRYGAPYWVIHRGDLQATLCGAVAATPGITLKLGTKVESFEVHGDGVAVATSQGSQPLEQQGMALIAADGLWSTLRQRLGHRAAPRAAGQTAWRTLVPADAVPKGVAESFAAAAVNLWLGHHAHLVHYPVKAGRMINVVAIVNDDWREPGWNTPGATRELLDRFAAAHWHASAREFLTASEHWQKWALFDCAPLTTWGQGPVTLVGDAAHPMLPYLAQGAAMAIEDAAVLAACLARNRDDASTALRRYEASRLPRTRRVQRDAHRNGTVYHMRGAAAVLRSLALMTMGGDRLINRYDWLYGWTPS